MGQGQDQGQWQVQSRGKGRGCPVLCPVQWKALLSRSQVESRGRRERKLGSSSPLSCSKGDCKQEEELVLKLVREDKSWEQRRWDRAIV